MSAVITTKTEHEGDVLEEKLVNFYRSVGGMFMMCIQKLKFWMINKFIKFLNFLPQFDKIADDQEKKDIARDRLMHRVQKALREGNPKKGKI